ncbi:hypothetical protein [Alicyclobacillus macrosporangiidus]|uniref:hypothetical protein n=1 Tax=Alicyclobacillus macrosporangiidus TaxID=392015 RepID=UPI0004963451|nr:hypothetical protein [Alicyclobacillus macrosporangiidus]
MLAVGLRDELKRGLPEQVPMCATLEAVGEMVNESRNGAEEILVDSAVIDQAELYTFRQQHPECVITYIVDDTSQAMTAFAAAHNIRLVQAAKLAQYLQEQVSSGSRLPILAFWGVYPRLGTTTIALAVAHVLAAQHGKNVGVFGLNAYNSGTWMLPESERNHHLDDVVSFLVHNKLDRDTLLSAMESVYRVRYLPGLRNQTQALTLQPEHMDSLIAVASSMFDVLVLDLGSVLNTAMALQGLRIATHRYVVANDLASTQRQFFDHFDYVLKPLGIQQHELMLVGSKLHGKGANFAKSVGLVPVAGIPHFPSIDLYAEQQSEPLKLFLGEKQFRKAVDTIVQSAVADAGVEVMAGVRA